MSTTHPVQYVNFMGDGVSLDPSLHARKKEKPEPKSFHKGWRVVGLTQAWIDEAERDHNLTRELALSRAAKDKSVKVPKPWDFDVWLLKAKKKPVRAKPYELFDAAQQCKELAEKAGWLYVDIVELKRD